MSVFTKLNLKGQTEILVVNAPSTFEPELAALDGVKICRGVEDCATFEFVLAFVTRQEEVDTLARSIARKVTGDAVVWFAYPKGTSKKYRCEFNRDSGWAVPGEEGFEPVRMVAIDEDWSALRFRRVQFIRTMTRSRESRLSAEGKGRAPDVKR